MSRKQRQAKILELISEKAIETQSELMEELYKNGYKTTQGYRVKRYQGLRLGENCL